LIGGDRDEYGKGKQVCPTKKEEHMQKVFVEIRFSAPPAEGSPKLSVLG
jgi:hypothetical protein